MRTRRIVGRTKGSKTAARTLQILKHFRHHSEWGVTELATATGFDKAVVHRILTSLVEQGFANRSLRRRRYVLDGIVFRSNPVDMDQPIALLNTPITTAHGIYQHRELDFVEAREIMRDAPMVESYIADEATAHVISDALLRKVPTNRKDLQQAVGQAAIVFRLAERAPGGTILTVDNIEEIGYRFDLLIRIH